jgi:hypothetical protein
VTDDFFEQIKLFLPKYLSPENTEQLFSELRTFGTDPSFHKNFYWTNAPVSDLFQGDGWKGFIAVDFDTTEKKEVSGVILSNSCDIDIRNPRVHENKVLFAPLIRLSGFEQLLRHANKNEQQIGDTILSIRRQMTTYIFYLPEIPGTLEPSIILLDDIRAQPLRSFLETKALRLFALSQYAFYLLLIKLSIHFSRFQEGISRF